MTLKVESLGRDLEIGVVVTLILGQSREGPGRGPGVDLGLDQIENRGEKKKTPGTSIEIGMTTGDVIASIDLGLDRGPNLARNLIGKIGPGREVGPDIENDRKVSTQN